ncbi:hypothetical protein CEXT_166521 [Caerostris extrusa]|uniref:Uncharacterized protein n=1 Tax=Caerostris extrusa TaxID=172846 RepID=A0AAV4V6H5_CAEEX|nr:hypothetical protein CEXT_166521 [Caerostris extrusa]
MSKQYADNLHTSVDIPMVLHTCLDILMVLRICFGHCKWFYISVWTFQVVLHTCSNIPSSSTCLSGHSKCVSLSFYDELQQKGGGGGAEDFDESQTHFKTRSDGCEKSKKIFLGANCPRRTGS